MVRSLRFRPWIWTGLLLGPFVLGAATVAVGSEATTTVKASVDKSVVTLGEGLNYQVEVLTLGDQQFSPDITLPVFEPRFQVDIANTQSTVRIVAGRTQVATTKLVHLIARQKGLVTIAPSRVELLDPTTQQRLRSTTEAVLLQVNEATGGAALPTPTPEIDVLRPEKTSARITPAQWLPFAVTGAVLALFFGWLRYLRTRPPRKPPEPKKPVDPRTPEQRALDSLKAAAKLKEEGRFNEFYTALSSILRRYLGEAYDFKAEEATTSELLNEMDRLEFRSEFQEKCRQYFAELDEVKFAGLKPAAPAIEAAFPKAQQLIMDKDKKPAPIEPIAPAPPGSGKRPPAKK